MPSGTAEDMARSLRKLFYRTISKTSVEKQTPEHLHATWSDLSLSKPHWVLPDSLLDTYIFEPMYLKLAQVTKWKRLEDQCDQWVEDFDLSVTVHREKVIFKI